MSNQSDSDLKKLDFFPSKTYIDGKWVDSKGGKTFEVIDPATNKVLGNVPDCNSEDANLAIESASKAFKIWSNYTAEQRSKILRKLAEIHHQYRQQLAEIMTYENGKPVKEALGEIDISTKSYEWFSEEAKRTYGDIIPSPAPNKRFLVIRQAVGVCGFITPWNFPAYMIARKASAALAAGCTLVIKPAEDTPYSALAFCQIAEMAGLPSGCINILTTSRQNVSEMGKLLCEHELVKKISFTGSTAVGKILLSQCAKNVKKVQMELGGNAPFVVFDSADLIKTIEGLMLMKFRNNGQTCISPNRILVQESIHDKFVEKLASVMKEQLKLGSGFESTTTQGPLINKNAIEKVDRLINDSKSNGANVIIGGKRADNFGENFYEPTLVTNINTNMEISKQEIFGPVLAIHKFKTEEEVVQICNSVTVGLASFFYSSDLSQIWRVAEKLEFGMVGINETTISTIEVPFGGIKESGFGVEGSKYGINEYLNLKLLCMGI